MRARAVVVALAAAGFAVSCAPSLTESGRGVLLTNNLQTLTDCLPVNAVVGETGAGASLSWSRTRLRNNAAKLGANAVLVSHEYDRRGSISAGVAYACPLTKRSQRR